MSRNVIHSVFVWEKGKSEQTRQDSVAVKVCAQLETRYLNIFLDTRSYLKAPSFALCIVLESSYDPLGDSRWECTIKPREWDARWVQMMNWVSLLPSLPLGWSIFSWALQATQSIRLWKLEQSEKRSATGKADTREAPAARLELALFCDWTYLKAIKSPRGYTEITPMLDMCTIFPSKHLRVVPKVTSAL